MESDISRAPAVQCHCKDSAAFSGNYFPGVDRVKAIFRISHLQQKPRKFSVTPL